MAVELATAYVTIAPSMRGMRKEIAKEMGEAGAEGGKELGEQASKSADKSFKFDAKKASAGLLGFSAVGAVGLYKLADAAGSYSEAQSKANVILGEDGAAAAEAFAEAADESFGLSKQAALDATSTFATLGKSAGKSGEDLASFSTDMVGLAGDLASFHDADPSEVIEALGAGLRGESEPLRRFGILLDDATLRAKAMELGIYDGNGALTSQQKILASQAEIMEQTSDAQGDYVRTSDSFANSQRSVAAELENLKIEIGEGVLPVAEKLLGYVSDGVGLFSDLSPEVKGVVGLFGGLAVTAGAALGAIGLISSTVGPGIGAIRDMRAALSEKGGLVGAIKGISPAQVAAVGAIAGGLAIYEAWSSSVKEVKAETEALTEALVQQGDEAIPKLTEQYQQILETRDGFEEAFEKSGLTYGQVVDITNLDPSAFNDFRKFFQDSNKEDPDWLRKFNLEADSFPESTRGVIGTMLEMHEAGELTSHEFRQVVDGMADLSKEATGGAEKWSYYADKFDEAVGDGASKKVEGLISDLRSAPLDERADILNELNELYPEVAESIGFFVDEQSSEIDASEDAVAGLENLEDAVDSVGDAYDGLLDKVDLLKVGLEGNQAAADGYAASIDNSTFLDDRLGSALALTDAIKGAFNADLPEFPDATGIAQYLTPEVTDDQRKSVDQVLNLKDAVTDYLSVLIETGNYNGARFEAGLLREEYERQLEALGLSTESVEKYIETLGLTPDQVETAIQLSDIEKAMFEIDLYQQLLGDEIPEEVTTDILAAIDEGDFVAVADAMRDGIDQMQDDADANPVKIKIGGELDGGLFHLADQARGLFSWDRFGSLQTRADGGSYEGNRPLLVGERGPELRFPTKGGTIVSNEDIRDALNAPTGMGGGSLFGSVTINGLDSPEQLPSTMASLASAGEVLVGRG